MDAIIWSACMMFTRFRHLGVLVQPLIPQYVMFFNSHVFIRITPKIINVLCFIRTLQNLSECPSKQSSSLNDVSLEQILSRAKTDVTGFWIDYGKFTRKNTSPLPRQKQRPKILFQLSVEGCRGWDDDEIPPRQCSHGSPSQSSFLAVGVAWLAYWLSSVAATFCWGRPASETWHLPRKKSNVGILPAKQITCQWPRGVEQHRELRVHAKTVLSKETKSKN